ncbi:RNA polymerase sigma factor SigJ [Amycolatopsis pigmentata]|uniref:RNA polymerase sigma factor SigJ n=1 Tax=Amycolatopsis pigmentata TaxID=450801 RepID=A0ABW5FN17_9PSEU
MPPAEPTAGSPATTVRDLRPRLIRLAYQLVGSVPEAEDIVQEALLRWYQAGPDGIAQPWSWLAKVVCHLGLDHLRSARHRRERPTGTWLPVPPVAPEPADPAEEVVLDEAIGSAVLVLLETLTPAQRVVFVLHEVFGWPFTTIAELLGRTPQSCRQLASRARAKVRGDRPRAPVDAKEHRAVVSAFREACVRGDVDALLPLLDDAVVVRSDGGAVTAARRPIHGRGRVATYLSRVLAKWDVRLRSAIVGGSPGIVVMCADGGEDRVVAVVSVVVRHSRVSTLDILLDPAKLAHLPDAMPAGGRARSLARRA